MSPISSEWPATLSYYVARQVRRNQESSKLLILTPHNDTVDDILDAVGLPPDNLPPSLYEFYLVMIYKQQILPTTLTNLHAQTTRANSTLLILKMLPSVRSTQKSATTLPSIKILERQMATIETIVQVALDFPKRFLFLLYHLQHGQGHRHWWCSLRLCFL